mmetsp:Transcript_65735/g.212113  ORF Transcript_65735/g.212113 Transcript_65735/m.212113 type:complete len:213 (+) Transcript_65735:518-1156(+)
MKSEGAKTPPTRPEAALTAVTKIFEVRRARRRRGSKLLACMRMLLTLSKPWYSSSGSPAAPTARAATPLPTSGCQARGTPASASASKAGPARAFAEVKMLEAAPQSAPSSMKSGSSRTPARSEENSMPLTAGLAPRPTWTTVAAKAAASRRLTMLSVSSLCGGFTTSTAKKRPAMGALKPAATPAAQPEASNPSFALLAAERAGPAWLNLPR